MSLVSKLTKIALVAGACSVGVAHASETLPVQKLGRIINYGNITTLGVDPTNNNDGCLRNGGGTQNLIGFDSTTNAGKQFLAMALTAKATDADVVVATNGCISFAGTTIPRVFRVEYR